MTTTTKAKEKFRNYDEGELIDVIRDHYHKMRSRQTLEYVQRMKAKYLRFDKPMTILQAMEELNKFVDLSDPDVNLPNVVHLIQAAEAIRADGHPDWLQLVGLLHDLGKVMYIWGSDEDGTSMKEQWGLVGDIFVVGCKLPDTCVYPEFNADNPDMQHEIYGSEMGIYKAGCGIDHLTLAWGHDEYLYQVLKNHPTCTIPEEGMVDIRYHSFYPWHTGGSYAQFESAKDQQYKAWIKKFNQYDLYTKSPKRYTLEEVWDYYGPIAEKYLGNQVIMW